MEKELEDAEQWQESVRGEHNAGGGRLELTPMVKSRKPDPAPTVPSTHPPAKGATLEQRTRYLLKEIGEEAGFLEQWIVHYLAELLERAEDRKAAARTQSAARAEIARVIPVLWEQQITREALHVRQSVDYWLRRTDTLDSEAEQLLSPLLADPDGAANVTESEAPNAFRALHTFAELVTRFLSMTAFAERTRREVTSEGVRRFLQRDEEVQRLQAALARIVPDFAALDPRDLEVVERLVYSILLALTQVQLTLLTHVSSGDQE